VKAYVEKNQLYEAALEIFRESDKLPVRVVFYVNPKCIDSRVAIRKSLACTESGFTSVANSINPLWVCEIVYPSNFAY
jgi:hypothetical protein